MKALKYIALFLSWLTISPFLLILDSRWKLLPKWLRILLFLVSPLMLMVFAAAIIICHFYYYDYYYPQQHFVRPKVVKNITGVAFPKYKVVDYRQSKSRWDRSDSFTLEFKEMPSEDFYKELDSKFERYEPGKYYFSTIWGNGIEAPKGESDNYDGTFRVEIEKDSRTFYIDAGTW